MLGIVRKQLDLSNGIDMDYVTYLCDSIDHSDDYNDALVNIGTLKDAKVLKGDIAPEELDRYLCERFPRHSVAEAPKKLDSTFNVAVENREAERELEKKAKAKKIEVGFYADENKEAPGFMPTAKPRLDVIEDPTDSHVLDFHDGGAWVGSQNSRFHVDHVGDSKHVNLHGVFISYGAGVDLLTHANLRLDPGERYGLIGRNGVGKTTLMKAIANGRIKDFPTYLRCLYLEQEGVAFAQTPVKCVLAGDARLTKARKREAELAGNPGISLEESRELEEVYEELRVLESDTAEYRAGKILAGLGFTPEMLSLSSSTLSGGWKMRLVLARALFSQPDVLLLDEPTNHLDLPAILWFQSYLQTHLQDTCVVCVSHDRNFLNAVCTYIIDFVNKGLKYYPGNFDAYEEQKADKELKQQRLHDNLERKRAQIEASIQRATIHAQRHHDDKILGMVASRRKKLERMGAEKNESGFRWRTNTRRKDGWVDGSRHEVHAVEVEKGLKFTLPSAAPLSYRGPVLQLDEVRFRYPGMTSDVLHNVNLDVREDSRIGIVGANGSGKSTLLSILTGNLIPSDGNVRRHASVKISYFTQQHVDQLDLEQTPLQFIMSLTGGKDGPSRGHLGAVGITGHLVHQKIKLLSGGEKSRVVFAALTYSKPHILVLDEPTNHLDYLTVESLIDAVDGFEGGVVIVSHDVHFISELCDEVYAVENHTLINLTKDNEDGFEEYVDRIARQVEKNV